MVGGACGAHKPLKPPLPTSDSLGLVCSIEGGARFPPKTNPPRERRRALPARGGVAPCRSCSGGAVDLMHVDRARRSSRSHACRSCSGGAVDREDVDRAPAGRSGPAEQAITKIIQQLRHGAPSSSEDARRRGLLARRASVSMRRGSRRRSGRTRAAGTSCLRRSHVPTARYDRSGPVSILTRPTDGEVREKALPGLEPSRFLP